MTTAAAVSEATSATSVPQDIEQPAGKIVLNSNAQPQKEKENPVSVREKYAQERDKRVREDGIFQYLNLATSDKYKNLVADPWINVDNNPRITLQDGMHTKVLIIGGGFAGILYAVRFIQAGISPADIIVVESGGGYGGTWYWNRYPGLMCDVESYIYLPLLEDTGYMPKHKYSYGPEIKDYLDQVAEKWHIHDRGAFQQSVTNLDWNENGKCWSVKAVDLPTGKTCQLTADFVVVGAGMLSMPQFTEFKGVDKYKGHTFHTARWDYAYTGGSPTDTSLINLKDKKVGIIGTGATAIQAVPHLARWAKELYIFQRTPSSVDRRDQHPTDSDSFKRNVASKKGWQSERSRNFDSFHNNEDPLPAVNMVDDGWSNTPSYAANVGINRDIGQDEIFAYIEHLHALDLPRSEMIRDRVERVVRSPETAEKLKAWYPVWCKRPCFHDDYLISFNKPSVHLVDTDGKGIDGMTENGVTVNNKTYDLDCVIFGTGFSFAGWQSPAVRANLTARGRSGGTLDDKWTNNLATLHGVLTNDFPNLFFAGPIQAAASANFTSCIDQLAQHCAYILSTALQRTGSDKVVIESTIEGEEEWVKRIVSIGHMFAGRLGCTPSYLNGEGMADKTPPEMQAKMAPMTVWGKGMNNFVSVLDEWRRDGQLKGLEITAA